MLLCAFLFFSFLILRSRPQPSTYWDYFPAPGIDPDLQKSLNYDGDYGPGPSTHPPGRAWPCYASFEERLFIFGGMKHGGSLLGDLWSLDVSTPDGAWTFWDTGGGGGGGTGVDFGGSPILGEPHFPGSRRKCVMGLAESGGDTRLRLFGGEGYAVVGGSDSRGFLNDVWDFHLDDGAAVRRLGEYDTWEYNEPWQLPDVHTLVNALYSKNVSAGIQPPGLMNPVFFMADQQDLFIMMGVASGGPSNNPPTMWTYSASSQEWDFEESPSLSWGQSGFPSFPTGQEVFWHNGVSNTLFIMGESANVWKCTFDEGTDWEHSEVRQDIDKPSFFPFSQIGPRNGSASFWNPMDPEQSVIVGGFGMNGQGSVGELAEMWIHDDDMATWDWSYITSDSMFGVGVSPDRDGHYDFGPFPFVPYWRGREGMVAATLNQVPPVRYVIMFGAVREDEFQPDSEVDVLADGWTSCGIGVGNHAAGEHGFQCSDWMCLDGRLNSDPDVCYGHGSCIGPPAPAARPHACDSCDPGWGGDDCAIDENSPLVPIPFVQREWYSGDTDCDEADLLFTDYIPMSTCLSPGSTDVLQDFVPLNDWNRPISVSECSESRGVVRIVRHGGIGRRAGRFWDCSFGGEMPEYYPLNVCIDRSSALDANKFIVRCVDGNTPLDPMTDPRLAGNLKKHWMTYEYEGDGEEWIGDSRREVDAFGYGDLIPRDPLVCDQFGYDCDGCEERRQFDITDVKYQCRQEDFHLRLYASDWPACDDQNYLGTRVYKKDTDSEFFDGVMCRSKLPKWTKRDFSDPKTKIPKWVKKYLWRRDHYQRFRRKEKPDLIETYPLDTCYASLDKLGFYELIQKNTTHLLRWTYNQPNCEVPDDVLPEDEPEVAAIDLECPGCEETFEDVVEYLHFWNVTDEEGPNEDDVHIAQYPDCATALAAAEALEDDQTFMLRSTVFLTHPTSSCHRIDESLPESCSLSGKCYRGKLQAKKYTENPFCFGASEDAEAGECFMNSLPATGRRIAEVAACYVFTCNGLRSLEPLVCSGHGKCVSDDVCSCDGNWGGFNCQTRPVGGNAAITVGEVVGLLFGVSSLCGCLVVFIVIALLIFWRVRASIAIQKNRMDQFEELDDIDLILEEQKLEKDETFGHLKIRADLFEIEGRDVRLQAVIGEGGGAAVVYKALWKGSIVAWKSFKLRAFGEEAMTEFERELQIMANVHHPSILKFFGACLSPPRVGYVMEFCPNGDLEHFVMEYQSKHSLGYPTSEKIRMLREVASAMVYLHSLEIIHRDIKPGNILVDETRRTKLMDFGISRFLDNKTQLTARVGTRDYLAPEVFRGSSYDEKCDVFSWAILSYVILTEEFTPYGSTTNLIEARVPSDATFRPDVSALRNFPVWCQELIQAAWDFDASERPSFEEIVVALNDENVESLVRADEKLKAESEKNMLLLLRGSIEERRAEIGVLRSEVAVLQTRCIQTEGDFSDRTGLIALQYVDEEVDAPLSKVVQDGEEEDGKEPEVEEDQ